LVRNPGEIKIVEMIEWIGNSLGAQLFARGERFAALEISTPAGFNLMHINSIFKGLSMQY